LPGIPRCRARGLVAREKRIAPLLAQLISSAALIEAMVWPRDYNI
jgi:hypothetical protein